jgi:lipopolysaccharide export LptBFGC system permease protein LptF
VRLDRRHFLFALAFLGWGICFYGTLAVAGSAWSECQGDGHAVPDCNTSILAAAWLVPLAILFAGGWLMKRLARKSRIDL